MNLRFLILALFIGLNAQAETNMGTFEHPNCELAVNGAVIFKGQPMMQLAVEASYFSSSFKSAGLNPHTHSSAETVAVGDLFSNTAITCQSFQKMFRGSYFECAGAQSIWIRTQGSVAQSTLVAKVSTGTTYRAAEILDAITIAVQKLLAKTPNCVKKK